MTNLIISPENSALLNELLIRVSALLGKQIATKEDLLKIPDIHILETDAKSIGIEDVKKLQAEMIYKPFEENYQVGIIFDAHKMTVEAQNAILKTLEEQSDQTVYFLLANNEKNLLNTIVSRSQKVYPDTGLSIEKEINLNRVQELVSMPLHMQFAEIEKLCKEEKDNRGGVEQLLDELTAYYRHLMEKSIINSDYDTTVLCNSKLEKINTARVRIRANVTPRMALEMIFL